VIKALQRRDVDIKDVAADLGLHPKTVSRGLKRGSAPSAMRRYQAGMQDPSKTIIDGLQTEDEWNGMGILRDLHSRAASGRVQLPRPMTVSPAAVRLSFLVTPVLLPTPLICHFMLQGFLHKAPSAQAPRLPRQYFLTLKYAFQYRHNPAASDKP
jgi:hypothetical protein